MNRDPPWTGARLDAGEVVSPAFLKHEFLKENVQ